MTMPRLPTVPDMQACDPFAVTPDRRRLAGESAIAVVAGLAGARIVSVHKREACRCSRWAPCPTKVCWRRTLLPARLAGRGDPTSIAVISDQEIRVGGGTQTSKLGLTETASHWDGEKWQAATLPAAGSRAGCVLGSIVPSARAGLEALGLCFVDQSPGPRSRLWRLAAGQVRRSCA